VWLDATAAGLLGVPGGLHAVGMPVAVAGEMLGMLVLVFDEAEPLDDDHRRLLAAISAAVGFAQLRDRLVEELRATVGGRAGVSRFERPAAGARPPGG
jgi:GAF domain-containing protein